MLSSNLLSEKDVNGINAEELAFYTPRRATVNYNNTQLVSKDMQMTRCFSKTSTGSRCERMTTIWPYCMTHTVHHLRLVADLQFGQFGLIAFDPYCCISGAENVNPIVFRQHDVIAPYTSFISSFMASDKNTNGMYTVTIAEKMTAAQMNKRYPGNTHAPFGVNTSLNAAAAEEAQPSAKRRKDETQFFDALFMRSIGSLANTTTADKCNAELHVIDQDVFLVATRDIRNTEAVLVKYGDEYLKAMSENQMPTVTYEPAMPNFPGDSLYR